MATLERTAEVNWEGTLMEGTGQVKAGTGAFTLPVSFPKRIGDPGGVTSPEEFVAAAHAACFAMALNGTLGRKGGKARRTRVTATVVADKSDAGIKLTTSRLKAVAEGLEGVSKEQFPEIAREAEGRCPISNALRGTMKIELEASAK